MQTVAGDLEELAAEVHRAAVGEVAAVRKRHAEQGITRRHQREIGRHIGLRTRMGLDIGRLGTEDPAYALDSQALHLIDELAAAVIALARIAFGVLVGEHRSLRFEHGTADVVLGGDHLQAVLLARELLLGRGIHTRDRRTSDRGETSWNQASGGFSFRGFQVGDFGDAGAVPYVVSEGSRKPGLDDLGAILGRDES